MVVRRGKIGIILQARMGSTRLPGKVLKPLAGKPMIQRIIERLRACQKPDILILATSTLAQEQPLVDLAAELGITLFRGSEADLLDRYYRCALRHKLEAVIRATGDNPFVDPAACDQLVDFYFDRQLDYATISTRAENGYPLGVGVEIFNLWALKKSWQAGHAPHHREHVNEYILENPALFKQAKMPAPPEKCAPKLSLTVDTIEQFAAAETIYADYFRAHSLPLVPVSWVVNRFKLQKELLGC